MVTDSHQIKISFKKLRGIALYEQRGLGGRPEGSVFAQCSFMISLDETGTKRDDFPNDFFDFPNRFFDLPNKFFDFANRSLDFPIKLFDFPNHFFDFPTKLFDFPNQFFDFPIKLFDFANRFFDFPNRYLISRIDFLSSRIKSEFCRRGKDRKTLCENPYAFAASGMANADPLYDPKKGRLRKQILLIKNYFYG